MYACFIHFKCTRDSPDNLALSCISLEPFPLYSIVVLSLETNISFSQCSLRKTECFRDFSHRELSIKWKTTRYVLVYWRLSPLPKIWIEVIQQSKTVFNWSRIKLKSTVDKAFAIFRWVITKFSPLNFIVTGWLKWWTLRAFWTSPT